ncbi:MAG: hypothetical protein UU08_C0019G0009 [Candidatus Uhrbacteria bacterium GW2011_GWE2_40_58]|nr:MAG: hypothetical protein UU08_C0019G0009 [Candidatus Uhrbacteria bacterium GW2011_GWE2_40_58]OGL96653.1 MAG: hypothetical protein A2332_01345 [Candidatus Uhrbacteria bacterium RIFOXYB2_FULL_41_18]HBK34730.1 hypothetical protein [Candidatus Uhrbacteria bacterium]HCB55855.1 hypothetical protein [Candidatus Uhrbacteria bacterium]
MRELTCNNSGLFNIIGQSGLDLEGCPPENLGVCGDDVAMSRAARTCAEGAFRTEGDISEEEMSDFWDGMVERPEGCYNLEYDLGGYLADEETEETDEDDCDDETEDYDCDGEVDEYSTMEAREKAEIEQINVRKARRELARRQADEKLQAELAQRQLEQWQAEQAAREAAKAEREAQANAKPNALQALAEQFRALSDGFTAAVQARNFSEAEKLDAQKRELKAQIDTLKAELEKEQAEEELIQEGQKCLRQLEYQQKRIPELEEILKAKDPEKDKAEIEKITGTVAFWTKNTPVLEAAVTRMEKILRSRQPKIEKPEPATTTPKAKTYRCKCCGKEMDPRDVKVEPFWVIERERNLSVQDGMSAEDVYGDRMWCLECIHAENGPKGDKIFALQVSMRSVKAWAEGRGERARRAEERREERRRNESERPARVWESGPGRPMTVKYRTIVG